MPGARVVILALALAALGCSDDTNQLTVAGGSNNTTNNSNNTNNAPEAICLHRCDADADCLVDGADLGLTCVDRACTNPDTAAQCTDDAQCVAKLSGWDAGAPCTAGGAECHAGTQACIEVFGDGHCVTVPDDFIRCETLLLTEVQLTDLDGHDVTVCGNPNASCTDGGCLSPCHTDDDCHSPAWPRCDPDSGRCGCGDDADCATLGLPTLSACVEGRCGCADGAACAEAGLGDACVSGTCTCTGDPACRGADNLFDGGQVACVPL